LYNSKTLETRAVVYDNKRYAIVSNRDLIVRCVNGEEWDENLNLLPKSFLAAPQHGKTDELKLWAK
jgi:hypothetical protein